VRSRGSPLMAMGPTEISSSCVDALEKFLRWQCAELASGKLMGSRQNQSQQRIPDLFLATPFGLASAAGESAHL
jgi:hypothetical protein